MPIAMGVVGEEEECDILFFLVPDLELLLAELLLLTCGCIRRGLWLVVGAWLLTGVAASVIVALQEGLTASPALSAS